MQRLLLFALLAPVFGAEPVAVVYGIRNETDNGTEPVLAVRNTTKLFDRYSRFVGFGPYKVEENEIEKADDPTAPLYGIYNECLFRLSYTCVQRKLLVFIDRIGRLKSFSLLGDMLSIVRTKRDGGPIIKEADLEARLDPGEASSALSALTEYNVERFLQNHILRVNLPNGVTASVNSHARSYTESSTGNTIDININRLLEEVTGRGKGDKKMKKLLGMVMTGVLSKMAFMGPFMVLLIKLKALKALILSKIALMLSLFQMFKGGGKKGGGGGGKEVIIVHDAHGGGGGGGHESLGSSGWASGGGGGWSGGGGGGGWLAAAHGDSYSSGAHTGGGDATYGGGGGDAYAGGGGHAGGGGGGGGWPTGGTGGAHGWARKSSGDPHWVAYRAYIPDGEE